MTFNKFTPLVALMLGLASMSTFAQETVLLDAMVVDGIVPAGNGLLNIQDSPQAKSVISREAIERKNTQNNPYQAMDLLPGVNTYSYDATGLFGGGLRMRGFNSDQIGLFVDGTPANDAGNSALYPSEYVDMENLEEISVTQGSNATDAPMIGATGGAINLNTSAPTDKTRFRVQQSYGTYNAFKSFVRADTGYLGDKLFKAYVSISKAQADKWKGQGSADREHLEFKGVLNLPENNSITAGFIYNEMLNHNFRTLTKNQIQTLGRDADFGTLAPQHLVGVNGTAQIEQVPSDLYYDLNINPFQNYLATLKGRFELLPNLHLDVDPYYIYGYGFGGNQLGTLAESNSPNRLGGGIRDINKDGDTLDTVMVYNSTTPETIRPGVTTRLKSKIANHDLMVGYWFEYARQRRLSPATLIGADGKSADLWLDNPSAHLQRQDGSTYQLRDYLTDNYSQSVFAQDDIRFFEDKLKLSLGFRYTQITRDFTNYPSDSFGAAGYYNLEQTYSEPLPNFGISYQLTDSQQIFFNHAQNFKAPGDFSYYGLTNGGTFQNGQLTNYSVNPVSVKKETSMNWDLGYRYVGQNLSFSGTLFYIDYKDRISAAYDPNSAISTNLNVGDAVTKGVELESAWRFLSDWSVYGSFTVTNSEMEENLRTGVNSFEATAGKALPDVPLLMAGAALQYQHGGWSASLSAKYTGKRYSTLVNDEAMDGYTLVSFDAGYRFASTEWFKNPSVKLNVYNLLDEEYLNLNAGSGSLLTNRAQGVGGRSPAYYVGAPTSVSVMLSTDF
ncbi:MAG: TonB-dependent receptor [Methylococcales bacterium]|nr:TonB-dependent receptor [Methylococcales bacterium]